MQVTILTAHQNLDICAHLCNFLLFRTLKKWPAKTPSDDFRLSAENDSWLVLLTYSQGSMDALSRSEIHQSEILASEICSSRGSQDGSRSQTPVSPLVLPPGVEPNCGTGDTPLNEGEFPNINHVQISSSLVDIPTPDTASVATEHLDLLDQDIGTPTPSVSDKQAEDTDSESEDDEDSLSYELQKGSRILREIMREANKSITWPFKNAVDPEAPGCSEYYQVVEKPIWLKKSKCT